MALRTRRVYLDHNATAPLLAEARAALIAALDMTGNPSSVHAEGRDARAVVEAGRREVAALAGADPEGVVFTSGATEAAGTCLTPSWVRDGEPLAIAGLAVAATDHACTRDGGRFDETQRVRLPVDADGQVRPDALSGWLGRFRPHERGMLCLSLANSETGVIQNLAPIRERLAGRDVVFVLDAAQAAGRLPLDIAELGADALFFSGHKLGAAKGVGAYVLRRAGLRPTPLMIGGGQERGARGGTEAIALIASFAAAAGVARQRLALGTAGLFSLRDRLIAGLRAGGGEVRILGEASARLPNTVAVAAPGLRAETAQIALDLEGFAVSSGSACSSGKVGPSHVIEAMRDGGLEIDAAAGAIRISFGYETTREEIDRVTAALCRLVARGQAAAGGLCAA